MNDKLAEQTIEDHKYLFELVENRAAIAYFAVANRNQSLFKALQLYIKQESEKTAEGKQAKKKKDPTPGLEALGSLKPDSADDDVEHAFMEEMFKRMIFEYDFMSVVMYPELRKRREFVHDAWMIAKLTENTELKIAISNDPYFYVTRDDLLQMLKTKDDLMIQHMLQREVMLHIREDVSYKLVKIKGAQVNQNQQTIVQLVDFISVLVMNKRIDQFSNSEVIFPHSHIVKFLETHKKFLKTQQAIKVFIMSRKFRLALQYLGEPGVEFEIDFFTFAIDANAYDIVFYLRYRFEEKIFQHSQKAIDSHVQSYQTSSKFLKAKLHLSKSLLQIFNFNAVKQFLSIMSFKIFDYSLENNIFTHSSNPLLNMCLLYELLYLISKKFFSLSYQCRQMMDQTKIMIIEYIASVDDENFLTSVMLEKDYSGRDSLAIAVELELLDLIQAPKVEAVIKRIWNSDYDTSGSALEMSTAYQILVSQNIEGVEERNRFYKSRKIEGTPQYDSNFNIFTYSMYSRLKGMGIVSTLFVLFSVIYYESAISDAIALRPIFLTMRQVAEGIQVSSNSTEIHKDLEFLDVQASRVKVQTEQIFDSFLLIRILCFFNLVFFFNQIMQAVFLKKVGRSYTFPTIGFFTDLILFITSIFTMQFITEKLCKDIGVEGISEEELYFRKLNNF